MARTVRARVIASADIDWEYDDADRDAALSTVTCAAARITSPHSGWVVPGGQSQCATVMMLWSQSTAKATYAFPTKSFALICDESPSMQLLAPVDEFESEYCEFKQAPRPLQNTSSVDPSGRVLSSVGQARWEQS